MKWLRRLFAAQERPARPQPWPYGRELISFQCNGCMGTDWQEKDRGIVVDRVRRRIYGGPESGTSYWVAQRADGTTFECYAGYCQRGTTDMQKWTDNPDEPLSDKLVHTI